MESYLKQSLQSAMQKNLLIFFKFQLANFSRILEKNFVLGIKKINELGQLWKHWKIAFLLYIDSSYNVYVQLFDMEWFITLYN